MSLFAQTSPQETKPPEEAVKPAAPAAEKPAEPGAEKSSEKSAEKASEDESLPESWLDGFRWKALLRFRPEYHGNFDFDKKTDDNAEFVGQKIQFGFEKDFLDDMTATVIVQDSRVWGGETGSKTATSTANDSTQQSTDLRFAWFEMRNLGPVDVRIGRQAFRLGEERLVGSADWSNVGRSFDGMSIRTKLGFYEGQILGAVLSEEDSDSSSNATHAGPANSSGFTYTCDSVTSVCTIRAKTVREQGDSYLGGFYNTFTAGDLFQFEAYYLGVYKKWIQKTTALALPNAELMSEDRDRQRDNLHMLGARLTNRMGKDHRAAWEIPLDWSLEYNWQTGPTGRRIDASWDYVRTTVPSPTGSVRAYSEKEKYDAFAASADAGWTFASLVRIGAAYSIASGDKNRTDGVVSTFNNLFPTNHGLYGQADLVSLQNLVAKSANVTFLMGKYGNLRLAAWDMSKEKLEDGWYDTTGQLKTGESTESISNTRYTPSVDASGYRASAYLRRGLFKEYDLTYSVTYKKLEIGMGYSRIQGGDSIGEQKNGTVSFSRRPGFDPRADFGYLMLTMTF